MRSVITILALALLPATVFGQVKTYKWNDGFCDNSGTFDSRKYSIEQIRDTVRLSQNGEFDLIRTDTTVFKYSDIDKLNTVALDAEYTKLRSDLAGLKVVDEPYWQKMWRDKLTEIDRVYVLSRATILGYKQPVRLRDVDFAPSCVKEYAEPLIIGGQSLIDAWLKVNMNSRSLNGNPEKVKERFDSEMASPDRLKFAQVEVMAFGWWNCANHIARLENLNTPEIDKNLRKLFIRVKSRCEEA